MSTYLNEAAVTEFDSIIKDRFQGMCMLKNFVDKRMGVVGNSYEFLNRNITEAQLRGGYGTQLPMVNNHYARPVAQLVPWAWVSPTDIFSQTTVNFDELSSLADVEAGALGRRTDKIIINAAKAATLAASNIIGDGGTNLTTEKLIQVRGIAAAIGIPINEITVAISALGLASLLNEEKITNIFYNDSKPLASGTLFHYLGMNIVTLPDNLGLPPDGTTFNGSLPKTGTVCTAYAFHKRAIGYAESTIGARVDYSASQGSWITNAPLIAGAVAVDPTGIISIAYDEAA